MKFLGKLFLVGLLSFSSLYGSELHKLFSLQDQEFADVTSNKLQKYKVNSNMILSMKLSKVDSLDGYSGLSSGNQEHSDAFFKLTFLNPNLKNWVYLEDSSLDIKTTYRKPTSLKFKDENGFELALNIYRNKICAGDRCLQINQGGFRRYNLKIIYANNTVTFKVNDNKLYSSKKRFSHLKSIEHTFFSFTRDKKSDILIDFKLLEIK